MDDREIKDRKEGNIGQGVRKMAYGINTLKKANGVDSGFMFHVSLLLGCEGSLHAREGWQEIYLVYAHRPQKIGRFYAFSDLDTVLRQMHVLVAMQSLVR